MKKALLQILLLLFAANAIAQTATMNDGAMLSTEACATASSGKFAPLWFSANRHGKVSPYANSSYERVLLKKSTGTDSLRQWRYGYGIDIQLCQNAQSKIFIQQAYAEIEWKKASLYIGQKERKIDLRNNELTSGGLSQGINARPKPEILLNLDYFSIPGTNNWIKIQGRIGYGKMLDGDWQKSWINDAQTMRYTSNYLYHEKAGYIKVGKEDKNIPLTLEAGLQMMTQFGGTNYNVGGRNLHGRNNVENSEGIKDFWYAFWPFGSHDVTDGTEENVKGNMLGSWNMAITWHGKGWMARGYFERFFEDHSQLFVQYGIHDHLLGFELQPRKNAFVESIVIEHISTKEQSGAVYHDDTPSMKDEIAGRDNYYNHNLYSGWQAWGMSMGTPLITSPIYNELHELNFLNNRLNAWHLGISGKPNENLAWRVMLTLTKNWGTYDHNFDDVENETHALTEISYAPSFAKGWNVKIGFALSHGKITGNTEGVQLTVKKDFCL